MLRVGLMALKALLADSKLELGPEMVEAGLPRYIAQRQQQVRVLISDGLDGLVQTMTDLAAVHCPVPAAGAPAAAWGGDLHRSLAPVVICLLWSACRCCALRLLVRPPVLLLCTPGEAGCSAVMAALWGAGWSVGAPRRGGEIRATLEAMLGVQSGCVLHSLQGLQFADVLTRELHHSQQPSPALFYAPGHVWEPLSSQTPEKYTVVSSSNSKVSHKLRDGWNNERMVTSSTCARAEQTGLVPLQNWEDEDVKAALEEISKGLADNIQLLSSWDKYRKEVRMTGQRGGSAEHTCRRTGRS